MKIATERHYLRQSPELISNGRYALSSAEADIFYALLTEIQKEDEEFQDYIFSKKQLETKLGVKLNTAQLRETAKGLMRKVFEIYRDNNSWEMMGFSYFSYENGVITCRFDKAMKPYLLELKQFVLADIRHLSKMKSEYAKRIYLMLKERQKFGERKFIISELMEQLEVSKSFKVYADFKRTILLKSVKNINKHTDIEIINIGTIEKPIYFEEHKTSRKVDAVTFHFKKNTNDLKSFIKNIREYHINEPLYHDRRSKRVIKCSKKGLLYFSDAEMEWIDPKKAEKLWEWLFENREKLFFHQKETDRMIDKLMTKY